MKNIITALIVFMSLPVITAQVPLTEIEGRLSVYLPGDETSIHIGKNAGMNQDTSALRFNTFVGKSAGFSNTTGSSNSFFGVNVGFGNTGDKNSFFGVKAGFSNTGGANSFFGASSGFSNTGNSNSFFGASAGFSNTGNSNSFFGVSAGFNNTGNNNSIFGNNAGINNKTGSGSVTIGRNAAYLDTIMSNSVYIGYQAGFGGSGFTSPKVKRSGNIMIGYEAGKLETGSNKLYIENSDSSSTGALIYGEFDNDILVFNGHVGIGTTNPDTSVRLHIGGDTKTARILFENAGDIMWKTNTGVVRPILTLHTDNNTYLDGENDIVFRTKSNFTRRMRIDRDGNVGIGIDDPSAPLHISDFMKLEPRTTAPTCISDADEGRIYYDETLRKFRGCVSNSGGASSHSWVDFH